MCSYPIKKSSIIKVTFAGRIDDALFFCLIKR